jgi:UDP-N-acetylmuramyl tripeptide synthase
VTEINKDEKTVVARSDFNVANVIAAIALLLLVLGLLKYLGVSPI